MSGWCGRRTDLSPACCFVLQAGTGNSGLTLVHFCASQQQQQKKTMTSYQTSSLPWKHNHDAAMTIADAFQEDPLFSKGFRNPRARFVFAYAIAAAQIVSGSVSADMLCSLPIDGSAVDGTKDFVMATPSKGNNDEEEEGGGGANPVQSVCLWDNTKDDFTLSYFELFLRNILMSFSIYFYLIKGAACTVGYHKQVGVLINSVLVILYGVCTLWIVRFLLELFRFAIVYTYMVMNEDKYKKRYEKDQGSPLGRRPKHLSMVGTLAASRGKGIGSALMAYSLKKHDDSNLYDYYYLESSNPKNVPFYERHGFVVVGEIMVVGEKATYMIRKKPTSTN
jgi:GNAT superfamily N-acetyltransferase